MKQIPLIRDKEEREEPEKMDQVTASSAHLASPARRSIDLHSKYSN